MRLLIDGTEIPWDPSALRTFGDVVEEAGRRAAAGGRVVARVVVDGDEVSARLEQEMDAARKLQLGMLPLVFPACTPEQPVEIKPGAKIGLGQVVILRFGM